MSWQDYKSGFNWGQWAGLFAGVMLGATVGAITCALVMRANPVLVRRSIRPDDVAHLAPYLPWLAVAYFVVAFAVIVCMLDYLRRWRHHRLTGDSTPSAPPESPRR